MGKKVEITLAVLGERLSEICEDLKDIKLTLKDINGSVENHSDFISGQKVLNWVNGIVLITVVGLLIKGIV